MHTEVEYGSQWWWMVYLGWRSVWVAFIFLDFTVSLSGTRGLYDTKKLDSSAIGSLGIASENA